MTEKRRQKPKPYIEAVARQIVPKFTKLCGLERMPYVTFSRPEVRQLIQGRKRNMTRYMGTAYIKENVIWLNPRHNTADDVRNSLAHEFCHIRFPYLAHGRRFTELLNRLLKGEQFKPHRKQKEAATEATS
jgi:predicted SprT family Zn-dependent metalloprotease